MNKKAFTLIELMVAMGIIAVLAGMSIYGITLVQRALRNTERRNALEDLNLAIEEFYNNKGYYPKTGGTSSDDLIIKSNGDVELDGTPISKLKGALTPVGSSSTTSVSGTRYCYKVDNPIGSPSLYVMGVELEGTDKWFELGKVDDTTIDCSQGPGYTITP